MAERKQFLGDNEIDEDLEAALVKAKERPITEEELHAQRVSFAFGNAMNSKNITRASVEKASRCIRLSA